MSNKTQLQTNNTALDALITRVNAAKDIAASLPDAGGSGGGDVETCTVQFGTSSYASLNVYATILDDDGNITAYTIEGAYSGTIENILCCSVVCIYDQAGRETYAGYGATKISTRSGTNIYKITANPGETAIINLSSSGGY